MPGPPISIYDQNFKQIVVLVAGMTNKGKTTLVNSLIRAHDCEHVIGISLDSWCYKFFTSKGYHNPCLIQIFKTVPDDVKLQLSEYIIKSFIELKKHKVYIMEGYVLTIDVIYKRIVEELNDEYYL